MKDFSKYIPLIGILIGFQMNSSGAFAQSMNVDMDTIVWNVDRFLIKSTNEVTTQQSFFITYGTKKIDWVQKVNGVEKLYSFEMKSSKGEWTDLNANGNKHFEVTFRDRKGNIEIKREGNVTRVIFEFLADGINTMPYEFFVTLVEKK